MTGKAAAPLSAAEVAPVFESLFGKFPHIVLAVSGGPDSMALMHLAAEWQSARCDHKPGLSVVTVDHGLRPESRSEAEFVAASSSKLGLAHTILDWVGQKPATGIQEAARAARYRLFDLHLKTTGHNVVATAHTRDDQAETLLMRLARGSGIDGLAGMRTQTEFGASRLLVRPMLGISKARLVATLKARYLPFIEDPSNLNTDFERVRLRAAQGALDDLGLSSEAVGLSAERLSRARSALETYAAGVVQGHPEQIHIDDLGFAKLDWLFFKSLPEDTALRILQRIIQCFGGQREPVSLSQLESMTIGRGWESPAGKTLAGTQFMSGKKAEEVYIVRELGRTGFPEMIITAGEAAAWDNRFAIIASRGQPQPYRIAALGPGGLGALKAAGHPLPDVPREALLTMPVCFAGTELAVAPLVDYAAAPHQIDYVNLQLIRRPFQG